MSAFCSYEKKKLAVIRPKDKGYRLRKQKSKNGMSDDLQNISVLKRIASQMSEGTQKRFKGNMNFSTEIVKY